MIVKSLEEFYMNSVTFRSEIDGKITVKHGCKHGEIDCAMKRLFTL